MMSAIRIATPKLPALRACCRYKRFKPQLARVVFLRKDLNQVKRIGCIVKRKMQH